MQVRHDERAARLLLERHAPYGLGWIQYEDGQETEVRLNTLSLVALTQI